MCMYRLALSTQSREAGQKGGGSRMYVCMLCTSPNDIYRVAPPQNSHRAAVPLAYDASCKFPRRRLQPRASSRERDPPANSKSPTERLRRPCHKTEHTPRMPKVTMPCQGFRPLRLKTYRQIWSVHVRYFDVPPLSEGMGVGMDGSLSQAGQMRFRK